MKKLNFTLSVILVSIFISGSVFGQACQGGTSSCQPAGTPGPGFEAPSTTTCATQGVAYNEPIDFTMFDQFDFLGLQDVDSIEFLTVDNLPCGFCWAVDQADKRYTNGEAGCLNISGTTNDAAGQYKLAISVRAWINGGAQGQTIPASLFDQTGIRVLVRVKTTAGACVTADTSASANNLTANPVNCIGIGINETVSEFSGVQLVPNPVISEATLSFIAEKATLYTVRVADVTGKVVSEKAIEAKTGANTARIERNGLPAGVYFLLLTDGKTSIAQRFTISE